MKMFMTMALMLILSVQTVFGSDVSHEELLESMVNIHHQAQRLSDGEWEEGFTQASIEAKDPRQKVLLEAIADPAMKELALRNFEQEIYKETENGIGLLVFSQAPGLISYRSSGSLWVADSADGSMQMIVMVVGLVLATTGNFILGEETVEGDY